MIDLESIREHLADELEPSRDDPKMFLCPLCGSGTGPHKTGALSIRPGTNGTRWRCFACGEHGNLFYLVAKRDGLTMADATRAMIAKYGSASTVPKRTEAKRKETEPVEPPPRDFSQEVQEWASSLVGSSAAVEYLRGRGITLDTAKRFKLGYDVALARLIIPYSPSCSYFSMRSLRPDGPRHFNPPGLKIPLFNPGALYAGGPCFIVESPLCAISICQAGGSASAISGTSGGGRLMAQVKKRKPSGVLLLALDMDEPGRRAQAEIADALTAAGIPFADGSDVIGSEAKDPNEALQADPEGFAARVALLMAKYAGNHAGSKESAY